MNSGGLIVSPEIDKWSLMSSPAPIVAIFVAYLIFVLKIGPRYMESRKPMTLSLYTRCYNIFQVISCINFLIYGVRNGYTLNDLWKCQPLLSEYQEFIRYKKLLWWFLMLRLAELSETVVFVLRKKQNQVSTLHVYHHISTAAIVWLFIKYAESENFSKKKLNQKLIKKPF